MKVLRIFFSLFLIFSFLNIRVQASGNSSSQEKRVIITYKNADSLTKFTTEASQKIKRRYKKILAATATLSDNDINSLLKDPNVLSIEEDKKISIKSQTTNWGVNDIHAGNAWSNGLTGKGVNIGVIDTGIEKTHEDLAVKGGVSFVDYTQDYNDDNGHGTHVAGIIGAKDNNLGVKGEAPDANLYAIKVMDATGEGYVSSFIAGIDWAISNKLDILNISAGSMTDSPALKTALDQAYQDGILVVAAGGNDGNSSPVSYPAQYDSVIAVSAVDNTNALASFSSIGPKIEVAAPGVNILSTCLNNSYCSMSGTSMAAPFVTGFLALLKEGSPQSTNIQLRNLLDQSVIDLGPVGRDNSFGYGLISFPAIQTISNPQTFNAAPTDLNVSLTWSPVSGATSYTLERDGKTIYTGTETSFLDTGVSSSTSYTYTIYTNDLNTKSSGVQITVVTKTSKPIVLSTVTPIFDNMGDPAPISYLGPQTVTYFENEGNWYKIHTWLGDKWLQLPDMPLLTFIENTPMYDKTDSTGKIMGYIGPQSVQSIGTFQNWFLIQTWLGNMWVKKENVIYSPIDHTTTQLRFDDNSGLYNTPFGNSNPISFIAPQTVVSSASWNGWYTIHTWLGDKWISGAHAIIGATSTLPITIRFDENTQLFQAPFFDVSSNVYMGPQTLTAFESWNGWYRVHTWLGDKWVSGKHAITGNVSSIQIQLNFNQVTAFYESPFTDASVAGYIAPQTITAFEKWGNWYRIHTWLGDKWLQDPASAS